MNKYILTSVLKLFAFFHLTLVLCISLKAQTPVLMDGFPVYFDSATSISPRPTSPIIADFDKDGENEILFAYSQGGNVSKVYLFNSNGLPETGWPISLNSIRIVTAAGDVDGNGTIDIVLRASDNIYVFDHTANLLPGFPVYFYSNFTNVLLYDLDNNDNLEIITTARNKAAVFNSDGSIRAGWPVVLPGLDSNRVYTPDLSAADLNNDGVPEIIIPSAFCPSIICTTIEINIYEPNGDRYLSSPIISDSTYYLESPASVYFINGTGYLCINSTYEIDNGSRTRTSIYDQNGILTERFYTYSPFNTASSITLGDVNKDNTPDFSFGYQGFSLYLFNAGGNLFNGWPIDANSYYYRTTLVQKFTDNLIVVTEKYADTTGGYSLNHGYIKFLNNNGIHVNWSPLRMRGIPETAGTFCDLNNDGILDMVVMSLYINNTSSPLTFGTMIYAWSFPGVMYDPTEIEWPMYGHDRYRTFQYGFIPPDEPVGIQPTSTNVPDKFSLFQNYPNPFNPATTIKFDIRTPAFTKLTVFDVLGREIQTLVNEELKTGSYSLVFDGSEYNSGVYFYRLASGDFTETKGMLLIK